MPGTEAAGVAIIAVSGDGNWVAAMPLRSDTVLRRLLSISRAIAGQMDYQSVLEAFAAELQHLISHDHADIVVLAKDGEEHLCYEVGLHTAWSELSTKPQPTERSPIRSLLWGDLPYLLTDDALADERFHFDGAIDGPIFAAELRSRIIVPLRVQGKVIGSLNISSHSTGAYGEDDVRVAQHSADLIAPYLNALARAEEARSAAIAEAEARAREKMLRTGALRLTEGLEQERQRLGMELHDQTLADLARLSRVAARLRRNGNATPDELRGLEGEIETCLDELRRIIEDMRPGVLQLFGFEEAVAAHLSRSAGDMDPPIETSVEDLSGGAPDALPPTIRTALYRITQEAVTNAVRHSGARAIRIVIDRAPAALQLEIIDDGRAPYRLLESSSGGVSHMRTRADLIGATLGFRAGEGGRGTVVTVTLPLNEEVPAPANEAAAVAASVGWD